MQDVASSVTTGTFFFKYINNDGPQVHWMSEIQFSFLNHIFWLFILSLLILFFFFLLLLLKMANEQFKGFN